MTLRLAIRQIHLILSLIAGLWLAVSGLTGSLLVFGDRLDQTIHPELYVTRTTGTGAAPLSSVLDSAEAASGGRATRMRLAGTQTPVHEVWIDCDSCRRVWVDPYTAEVRGVRSAHGTTRTFLHEFHRRLFLGQTGDRIVGAGGLFLVTLVVSGLVLAWPKRSRWKQALSVRFNAGWKRLTYDGHRSLGLVAAPLLLISGFTGAYFIFHKPVDRVAAMIQPSPSPSTPAVVVPSGDPIRLEALVGTASREFPLAELTWITPPASPEAPLLVRFRQPGEHHPNGRTFVYIDPYSGTVLNTIDAQAAPITRTMLNNLYPIHIGAMGGTPHRSLLVIVGTLPAFFMATGIALWLSRRKVRNSRARERVPDVAAALTAPRMTD